MTALVLGSFATSTLLTKNSFLDEIKKAYVQTARMKGLTERRVLYGHVFRNAMLIVIAGFPGAFIAAFFTGSLLIEQVFSLDGLGYLSYDSLIQRDYPVVLANLYIFALIGLVVNLDLRPHLHLDRSAHRFRDAGGLRPMNEAPSPADDLRQAKEEAQAFLAPGPADEFSPPAGGHGGLAAPENAAVADEPRRLDNFRRNRRGYWSFWIFLVLFVASLGAEFVANDRPLIASYKGELLFPVFVRLSGRQVRRLSGDDRLSRSLRRRRDQGAWLDDLAADPLRQFDHHPRPADAPAVAADLAR